jgi:hypothetical protein
MKRFVGETGVIRIYPNEASAIRLIGALLLSRMSVGHRTEYLDMQAYYEAQAIRVDADKAVA